MRREEDKKIDQTRQMKIEKMSSKAKLVYTNNHYMKT